MIANHLYAIEIFGRKKFQLFGICEWATSTQRKRQKQRWILCQCKTLEFVPWPRSLTRNHTKRRDYISSTSEQHSGERNPRRLKGTSFKN